MATARSSAGLKRRAPVKRMPHRRQTRRQRIGWRGKLALALVGVVVALVGWAAMARAFAPHSNTELSRFDAVIVLGDPADSDGNPTPEQLARVNEGVREYERSIAPRIIMTGGPAHNRFVEADVMAKAAAAQGIPASQILVEPRALDTIQNVCYAARMMKEHGWNSAEVVSSAGHLPRAALILERSGISWRTHAAPPLEPHSNLYSAAVSIVETVKTMRYLVYTQWAEKCTN